MQLALQCEFPGKGRKAVPNLAHLGSDQQLLGDRHDRFYTLAGESAG